MKTGSLVKAVFGAILKVVLAVAAVFIIYRGATICYDYGYRIFTEPAVSAGEGRTVKVTLKPDMSALEIGEMMEEKGLTRDGKLFALQYLCSEYKEDVAPGTYEVSTAMTAEEIMAAMVPTAQEDSEPEISVDAEPASDSAVPADGAGGQTGEITGGGAGNGN